MHRRVEQSQVLPSHVELNRSEPELSRCLTFTRRSSATKLRESGTHSARQPASLAKALQRRAAANQSLCVFVLLFVSVCVCVFSKFFLLLADNLAFVCPSLRVCVCVRQKLLATPQRKFDSVLTERTSRLCVVSLDSRRRNNKKVETDSIRVSPVLAWPGQEKCH